MPVNWISDYDRARAERVKQQRAKVARKRREKWEAMKAAMVEKRGGPRA